MSKRKPRTRFVVEIDGVLRRLLSIRQNTNGELFIRTHLEGLQNFQDGTVRRVKESRLSIHVSPGSDSNNVRNVIEHEDATIQERHLSTNALRDDRFQPIYVRLVVNPHDLPALDLPVKGDLVPLPSYNPSRFTMLYAVWFAAADADERALLPAPFSFVALDTLAFKVIVAFCYTADPTPVVGMVQAFSTTTPEKQTAEERAAIVRTGPVEGVQPHFVTGYMVQDFNRLIALPPGSRGLLVEPPLTAQRANFKPLPTN